MFDEFLLGIKSKSGVFIDYKNSNIVDFLEPSRVIVFNLKTKEDLLNWQEANIKSLIDDMKVIIILVDTKNIATETIREFFIKNIYSKIDCFIDDICFYMNGNCKDSLDYPISDCNIKGN